MAAMAQHQEVEFFARQGCTRPPKKELEAYWQQWQNPPSIPSGGEAPLAMSSFFGGGLFCLPISMWLLSPAAGEEEQVLHFID